MIIHQSEAAECGLACLAMVASAHGRREDLASLRRRFPVSLKGARLNDLMRVADGLEMDARPVKLEMASLPKLKLPAILHWDLNHFVVLKKVGRRRAVILDPARGERRLTLAETAKHFTGVALELTPAKAFKREKIVSRPKLSDLWGRIKGLTPNLVQLFLLSVVLQAFALASPFYTQLIVDEAITKGDLSFLTVLAMGFGLLLVIQTGVSVLRELVTIHFSTALSLQMAANLFRHLVRLPAEWFEKRHVGDVTSRFGAMGPIQSLLTSGVVAAVLDSIMAIATLVMIFLYAPLLAAITIAALIVYLGVRVLTYPIIRAKTEEGIVLGAKESSLFLESIRAAKTIKLFGAESERQTLWHNAQTDSVNAGVGLQKFQMGVGVTNTFVFGLENIIVLWLGAKMVIGGELTLGMLFAFQSYRGQFTGRISALIDQIIAWRMIGLHLDRLADIVGEEAEKGLDAPIETGKTLEGALELKNVSFRYAEGEPWVLKDVSLAIRPGETAAFVGPSGGGKTTMLKIMLGLLRPTEGEVRVDGAQIDAFGVAAYRRQIGVVMQDDALLAGTVADNIAFFDPKMDMARVEACARAAFIHDDVAAMPMGYLSLIGDRGTTLSGGQKQRVLIARAFYRNPRLLFLDEGTANLDELTEARICETLAAAPMTKILIAHRPAMIRMATRVFAVAGGRVVEAPRTHEGDVSDTHQMTPQTAA